MSISKSPWTRGGRTVYDSEGHPVAMCWGGTSERGEEIAQIVSAIPEMLEALEEVMEQIWVVIDIRDIGKELLEICTLKEGEPVCVARIDHRNNKLEIDKEDEANANLIASAPEMLEALTLVKTMIDNHAKHWRNGSGYQKICVAIQKARGEE